ncbi:MAG: hypothetical protein ABIT69_07920 [Sphingomicrobium sp.]
MDKENSSPDRQADSSDPATDVAIATAPGELDAHGHDPAAYEWWPVLRRPRSDGWTPQRQRDFIAALADTGCVAQAAMAVDMTDTSCYRLRRAPGAEHFAAAWDAALANASRRLVDLAFDRAINGCNEPVFDKEGLRVGRRMRPNDRLLMFLLRAYMPERFRYAHHSLRLPGEEQALELPPVGEALRRLEPVAPEEPHLLMAPELVAMRLDMADMLDGELPHWHRGTPDIPEEVPVDEELERMLEAAKRGKAAYGEALKTTTDPRFLAQSFPNLPPSAKSARRKKAAPRQRRKVD